MSDTLLLLTPRWKKLRSGLRDPKQQRLRLPFMVGLILALWGVIYVVFVKALGYFISEEMFVTIAATNLLSMILMTFTFVVFISNIITTFSSFFLSEDLELLISSPVPPASLYRARFVETLIDSSWMVLVFGFPVFLAYGKVFKAPLSFYGLTFAGFVCLLVMTTAAGIVVVQILVKTFPVRRLRDFFVFVGLLLFVGAYLLFRMIRPEEFLNPEGFASLMDYLSVRSDSGSLLVPTTWLMKTVLPYITGTDFEQIVFYFGLLVLGAISTYRLAGHYHEASHFSGYSKAMESKGAKLSRSRIMAVISGFLNATFDSATAQLVRKEILLMARDWGRLSQLLLLTALVVVYLYNFKVLPSLDTPAATLFLNKTVAFVNIGLAGFVLSSLGVRFIFPAVSSEGRAFWILKGSPVGLRKILMVKFSFYLVPMLMIGLFLVIMTNQILGLGGFMFFLSTLTVVLLTVGITSLALGMGVLYADLKEVDPNRVFSGFGGLVTMLYSGLAVSAVILLEAYPVFQVLHAEFHGYALRENHYLAISGCLFIAIGVILYMIIQPMRNGLEVITELEV
ncbi:MAG: hypothetical protein AB1646_13455 [Thermodesulfobacteriota bacterium]